MVLQTWSDTHQGARTKKEGRGDSYDSEPVPVPVPAPAMVPAPPPAGVTHVPVTVVLTDVLTVAVLI